MRHQRILLAHVLIQLHMVLSLKTKGMCDVRGLIQMDYNHIEMYTILSRVFILVDWTCRQQTVCRIAVATNAPKEVFYIVFPVAAK